MSYFDLWLIYLYCCKQYSYLTTWQFLFSSANSKTSNADGQGTSGHLLNVIIAMAIVVPVIRHVSPSFVCGSKECKSKVSFSFFFYGCHYRHHKNFLLLFLLPSWFFKSGMETDRVELQWKKKRWKGLGRVNWREQSKGDGGVTCWQRSSQNCQSSSQYQ